MRCAHCGAELSLQDMTRPNCPYCQHVLPHHARAAEHAALVNQVLDQRVGASLGALPPELRPQIGYEYGAGMTPGFQQFQAAHQAHAQQVVRRATWIVVLAVVVPIVLLVVMGLGAAVWFMF
ncbi:MAG: hypothetical protein IT376_01375 [Polyangiaceae bacterium]|nr:hypothetical protein [Polyangiaceae bacterium]